jgi:catechol 2,3-dioxygenase-like lactoylglutathione lyase family enzyme
VGLFIRRSAVESWPGGISAITLFVQDVVATKAFYGAVFGLPVVFEDDVSVVYRFGSTLVNLLAATEAPELIEPAVVAPPGTGATTQFTLTVEDVDAVCAELATRGVTLLNGPIDRPWGVRTACFADPSGHIWEIAH